MTVLEHISEKSWSDYTKSDYTLEQWHNACLIHLHQGPPTSKGQCKLPVKTPIGALNRNGVHSALAALHGARAPLNAPSDQKTKAERRLRSLYAQLGEKFPSAAMSSMQISEFLQHYGKKGMRWGVRSARSGSSGGKTTYKKSPKRLSNEELGKRIKRLELEKRYSDLSSVDSSRGKKYVTDLVENASKQLITQAVVAVGMNAVNNALKKGGK